MNTASLIFMVLSWGVILAACVIGLTSLLKHSK